MSSVPNFYSLCFYLSFIDSLVPATVIVKQPVAQTCLNQKADPKWLKATLAIVVIQPFHRLNSLNIYIGNYLICLNVIESHIKSSAFPKVD